MSHTYCCLSSLKIIYLVAPFPLGRQNFLSPKPPIKTSISARSAPPPLEVAASSVCGILLHPKTRAGAGLPAVFSLRSTREADLQSQSNRAGCSDSRD